MYKILLIEDEAPARKKLKRYLSEVCTAYEIVAELESIQEVQSFLSNAPEIDLIFSDIELRDGNVFEVYDKLSLNCPIIFATAYHEFLINAFEANGIEYLLKPYSLERFAKAWNKFTRLSTNKPNNSNQLMASLQQLLSNNTLVQGNYKDQFAIKSATETYFLKTDTIVYFQADEGVIFAFDHHNKRHTMPQTSLKEIEISLDPEKFFRINRSQSIQRKYIDKIKRYDKNSLCVYLNSECITLKTSQNKTSDFSSWLGV